MRSLLAALLVFSGILTLAACKSQPSAANPRALLSAVKTGLDSRDRKLTSYSLEGLVREAGQEAKYTFQYRAPGKMIGAMSAPAERTFAYDGKTLFDVDPKAKTFTRVSLEGAADRGPFLLNQIFGSFVSEGYRVPLLVREGLLTERIAHVRAPQAVKLTQTAKAGGEEVTVSYVLRWPALDFLEKTVTSGAITTQVRVEEEHCDEKLALCVPKKLSQWQGEKQFAVTELSDIQLNPGIPADDFTLHLPPGFTEQTRALQ